MKLPYQDTEVAKEAAKCMSAGFIEQHSNQKKKRLKKEMRWLKYNCISAKNGMQSKAAV